MTYQKGLIFVACGMFFFSLTTLMAKLVAPDCNTFVMTFFRNFFGFIILASIHVPKWLSAGWPSIHTSLAHHFCRAMFGFLATLFLFYSFSTLTMQDATGLTYTGPLFLIILSAIFLREHLDWPVWCAVIVGFLGTLLIIDPSGHLSSKGCVAGLAAAFMNACALCLIKKISKLESSFTITFYYLFFASVFSAPFLLFFNFPTLPRTYIGLAVLAGFSSLAHYLIAKGLKLAPASRTAPLTYTTLIWATLADIIFWNGQLRTETLYGTLMIMGCGVFIALRREKEVPAKPNEIPAASSDS